MNDRLVWIDCEMTGLDLRNDALIEIAVLVTDGELAVLGEGVDIVIHADDAALANMPDVVRDMHAHSGLTDEVRQSVVTIAEAQERVLAYVRSHVPDPRTAPLAGNSIATDRGFIARTPRGRIATAAGFQHLGLAAPTKAPTGGSGNQGRLF